MKIIESNNTIKIDQEEIIGFIAKENCPKCNTKQIYYAKFDSCFCPKCNIWLETQCSDLNCNYCHNRPAKPLN